MQSDPIITEIRQIREDRAARFGFDIGSIVRDAQDRDVAGDRVIVSRLPRRPSVTSRREAEAIKTVEVERVPMARQLPSPTEP